MRQIWIPKAGPPEVLEVREARDPLLLTARQLPRVVVGSMGQSDRLQRRCRGAASCASGSRPAA